MRRHKTGFTVIELTIVAALAAVVAFLAYGPVVNGLIMTQRESALMGMLATGDAVTTRLAAVLQPAIIPAVRPNPANPLSGVGNRWENVLEAGTDLLPFCTPVQAATGSAVDGDGNPVLGIVMPGGAISGTWTPRNPANPTGPGTWTTTGIGNLVKYPSGTGIHRDLAAVDPDFFGFPNPSMIDEKHTRFAARLEFPADSSGNAGSGYAVIRFVPDRVDGNPKGEPVEKITEQNFMGPGRHFDLDGDGDPNDTFIRGKLVLEYANSGLQSDELRNVQRDFPLGRQAVLLQLNTDDDETYAPIFQFAKDDKGNVVRDVLRVRLLLFDERGERNTPMATGRNDGRQFLARRVETTIELRNMTF